MAIILVLYYLFKKTLSLIPIKKRKDKKDLNQKNLI